MKNLRIAEIMLNEPESQVVDIFRQVGISEITGTLNREFPDFRNFRFDEPWDYTSMLKYKMNFEERGLKLSVIEDNPPMEKIIYGLPEKEEQLESVAKLIENMGKLGISVWCYNWMATGWFRSRHTFTGRGGALVGGFDIKDAEYYNTPKLGKIGKDSLWKNLENFLKFIIPIAEESNVMLAMHPDDPPIEELFGVARIMNSFESFKHLVEVTSSHD